MSIRVVTVLAAAGLVSSVASAQSFTPGNLVVSIADLTPGASNTGRALQLQQFDLTGTLSATANGSRLFALPASPNATTTVANSFVISGTATSEGYITLSQDRSSLGVLGYNTWIGRGGAANIATGSVATTVNFAGNTTTTGPGVNVARIAASVPANYSSTSYTLLNDTYSGSNARSAQPTSGGGFLLGGTSLTNNTANRATGGARVFTSGSTSTRLTGAQSPDVLVPSLVNTRQVATDWSGNNVIIATQQSINGITPGLYQVISGNAVLLPGFAAPAAGEWGPNDFAFMGDNTIYVADDGSAGASNSQWGGLQRWDFNGTQWNLSYVINQVNTGGTSPVFAGLRSITVISNGSQNIIYGVDTAQRLVGVVDAGAGSVMTQLAASSTTLVFRGVEMTPGTVIPTPGVLALVGMGGLAAARRRR